MSEQESKLGSISAAALASTMLSALRPPPPLTLSEWADRHYYLSPESAAEPGKWHTLPYQREPMDCMGDAETETVSWKKSARVGYALALDTPLPTPAGWTTMGEVKAGDYLIDERGNPCRVVTKSPVHTNHDCYRIKFCDGSTIIADGGHRWRVESFRSFEYLTGQLGVGRTGRPKGKIHKSGLLDTATMHKAMIGQRRTVFNIPNAMPINGRKADLPIPPYTLGLWLGDGHLVTPRVTQHRSDVETAEYVRAEGIAVAVRYIDERYPNNATLFIGGDIGQPSYMAIKFRKLGLLSKKSIPQQYLRASVEQRLQLLRGLMDSDGTISADGRAEFNNTNKNLIDGVYELLVSLGYKCSLAVREPKKEQHLRQWRVNFKPQPALNPFNIKRKAEKVQAMGKPTITLRRGIVSIEPIESVPVQCVQVDSPSSLYLAGKQMVPTHNTKCLNAAVGYFIDHDPCPIMLVQPSDPDAEEYSKDEIFPMIRDCPRVANAMSKPAVGEPQESLTYKPFKGGVLHMVGAQTPKSFRRVSRRVIMLDEINGYPESAGKEGDPVLLAKKRAEYYWNRKFIEGSTPTIAGHSRIDTAYEKGDQRNYYVPCPHCEHKQVLKFERFKWPKGKPEEAKYACEGCGALIDYRHQRWMVTNGEWRATKPENYTRYRHASFHIWQAYSFSPNASWGQIAKDFVSAEKEGYEALKTFVNTVLGESWKDKGDAPDWQILYERREQYAIGSVPLGGLFLTCGVDVQKHGLIYSVKAWGRGKQSWGVEWGTLVGDPAESKTWLQLDALLQHTYRHASGTDMRINIMAVDSGAYTQHVYNWCRKYPMNRVMAIKGMPRGSVLLGSPVSVDVSINGKRMARGYKYWPVGGAVAKSELYGWLKLEKPTVESGAAYPAGYCHFPEYGEEYFKQLTAEQLIPHKNKRGYVNMEWQLIPGRENHVLDAEVYARAAAALFGLDRLVENEWIALETALLAKPEKKDDDAPSKQGHGGRIAKRPAGWIKGRR